MGREARDCWVCDVCGFVWLVGEVQPVQCPSRACRSSRWNAGDGGAKVARAAPRVKVQPVEVQPVRSSARRFCDYKGEPEIVKDEYSQE